MSIATTPATPLEREVRELRQSSRMLVRALGLMQNRIKELACTPAQCHALLELAERGRLTTGELAELLEVDKSTASRTLSPLLRNGLVQAQSDPGDQRTKPMHLTESGRARVSEIHAAADTQVRGALDLLTEEDRATVLSGVALYERALHRAKALEHVTVRPIEARDEAAMAAIIRSVMIEHGAVGNGYSIEDEEVDTMCSSYLGDRSAFFVAIRDGEILGGGGIAPLQGSDSDDVCELRKMYALPAARGLGIGRQLLERCLTSAREFGFRTCYLETLQHMHRARVLYEKLGFEAIDGPMGNTGHHACDGWYALKF
ncbi:MAG: putative acetyltransferase [Chlamydiales bacterium]|jgi:putative acetyltransferase